MQHPEAKRDEFLALIRELEGKSPRIPQVKAYYQYDTAVDYLQFQALLERKESRDLTGDLFSSKSKIYTKHAPNNLL